MRRHLLAVLVAGLGVWFMPERPAVVSRAVAGAEAWSGAAVAFELERGKPVFVYFTADWCLTCKANEATAIDRKDVQAAFKAAGVRVLAGDWTNGDPEITRFLESRGRAGVPLYLWYAPGREPEELPQILTPGMLISRAQALRQLARAHAFFPATQVSSTCVRASACASTVLTSRSTMMKSAHLPGSSAPNFCSA